LIISLYFTGLIKFIIPAVKYAGFTRTGPLALGALLLSVPVLAMLVAMIEKTGPLKNWAIMLLLGLFFPALVLNHDLTVLHSYMVSGRRPFVWGPLLVNALVLKNGLPYLLRMVPRPCPSCRRRTLIPLLRLFRTDKPSASTCWCACCGAKFLKGPEGEWRLERRKTWLEELEKPATPAIEAAPTDRCPVAGPTTHRLPARRTANRSRHP
jgi:hypothetical protein